MKTRKVELEALYKELETYQAVADVLKCNASNVAKHLQQIKRGDKRVVVELGTDGLLVSAEIIKPLKTIQPNVRP